MSKAQPRDSQGRFLPFDDEPVGNNRDAHHTYPIQVTEEMLTNEEFVENAMLFRRDFISKYLDVRRDIDKECGYKKTEELSVHEYKYLYDRESVARRVVEVLPQESWRVTPEIYENDDTENVTPFEEDWKKIGVNLASTDSLNPDSERNSWFEQEESNPIWSYLLRADVLSGIGTYGVILLGLNDGADLIEPVTPSENMELLYLRVLDESLVSITAWETDPNNPRYDRPLLYSLSLNDHDVSSRSASDTTHSIRSVEVHWSRVIHIADNLGSSEILGIPRMQTPWNRLYDLRKLYGGSAEMYWMGAFPGLSFETHPNSPNIQIPTAKVQRAVRRYKDGLQRWFAMSGLQVKSLAPQVSDPSKQIEAAIKAICILLAIPERVFMGSERGELASSQDARSWNNRCMHRQKLYITPKIIVPFIDRLIQIGVLREPTEGYKITWPDLNSLTPLEESQVNTQRIEQGVKYLQGGLDSLMAPIDFFTRFFDMSKEEAEEVLKLAEEKMEEAQALIDEQLKEQGLDPYGNPVDGGDGEGDEEDSQEPFNTEPVTPKNKKGVQK